MHPYTQDTHQNFHAHGNVLLVFEDEEAMGALISLRPDHLRVSTARNGLSGVEKFCRAIVQDEAFDVVVAQYVITTVPHPEATLDEFARVLKPGGELILVNHIGAEMSLALEERGIEVIEPPYMDPYQMPASMITAVVVSRK